jgi:hypothetical protein
MSNLTLTVSCIAMSMRTSFGGTPNLSSTRQSMPISMSLAADATLSFAVGGFLPAQRAPNQYIYVMTSCNFIKHRSAPYCYSGACFVADHSSSIIPPRKADFGAEILRPPDSRKPKGPWNVWKHLRSSGSWLFSLHAKAMGWATHSHDEHPCSRSQDADDPADMHDGYHGHCGRNCEDDDENRSDSTSTRH